MKIEVTEIKTLGQLAEYINSKYDYPNDVVDLLIEKNGWTDTSDKSIYDICTDGKENLVLDENYGIAKVMAKPLVITNTEIPLLYYVYREEIDDITTEDVFDTFIEAQDYIESKAENLPLASEDDLINCPTFVYTIYLGKTLMWTSSIFVDLN